MTQQNTKEESESQTVWYTRGERTIYHTNPECEMIKETTEIREVEKKLLPNFEVCKTCKNGIRRGEYPPSQTCELCGREFKKVAAHLRNCPKR